MIPPTDRTKTDSGYLTTTIGIFEKDSITHISVHPLAGDASDRRYERILYTRQGHPCSLVLMKLAQPHRGDLPFINVHSFLKKKNVRIPKIYFYDDQRGYLFLEDCGDTTLETKIQDMPVSAQTTLYKKAIHILLAMQCSNRETGECIAHTLFFDPEKLMWELTFMLEHMVKGLLGKNISQKDLSRIEKGFYSLCMELQKEPRVFTHRDYHSRNIMVQNENLFVIDFQDARMGPCQYDLVSLLRDSYTSFSENFVCELLEYYIQKREEQGDTISRETFRKNFDLMSIQRNLKAIGTFAFQKTEKKNSGYERYIRPTLSMVESNLSKHEEFKELKAVLGLYLPFQE